jgi:hypothetical protein
MRDQEQPENVEYYKYKYFGSMIRSDAVCTCEIKRCIALATAAFMRKRTNFTTKLEFNLKKKLVQCCIWSILFHGAETWTLGKVAQKYVGSCAMWCC